MLAETQSQQELSRRPQAGVDLLMVPPPTGAVEVVEGFQLDPVELLPVGQVADERGQVLSDLGVRGTEPEDQVVAVG